MIIKNSCRNPEFNPLIWRMRLDKKTVWLDEYKSKNGYVSFHKVINNMSQNEVIKLICDSQLRGRGGGGFLTGEKWTMMVQNKSESIVRYLICNADEMEPGTYKDRFLMEQLPHLLLEGILISGYALGITRSYIFLRYEYINAAKILRCAIDEIKSVGLLGKNILNRGFNFELFLHTGAGRYICGEETALINALEGNRAIPRSKPPFPAQSGLWGKPTCINNVETLCNIPGIVEHGAYWYKNISKKSNDAGTKLMGISGRVKNPGIWELPFGVTAREIVENYAQGMYDGYQLKAWQPGGASTDFLTQHHLDVPMDFKNISLAGSRFGTGMMIVVDNSINMVSLVRNLEEFFARESCGWCTPCRDGLPWIVKLLISLENNVGNINDIEILENLCDLLGPGKTFCAHAPGAIEPLRSALKYFRSEFESGINKSYIDSPDIKYTYIS